MPHIVSCLCWVGQNKAKEIPDKVQLDPDELAQLMHDNPANNDGSEDKDEDMDVVNDGGDVEGLYGLDDYETDEGVKTTVGGLAGLMYYANEDDDPYITLKDEEDEEEKEDYIIRPDDNLLLVGKAQEEFSSIEVHVFNWKDNHCYCHHEIMINDHPLVIEWLDYDPEQPDVKGNMIAVGGMSPVIEVWDLDLVDGLEPVCVLGTSLDAMTTMMKEAKKKLKKKSREKIKKKDLEEMVAAKINKKINGHIDAVIGLSWNGSVRNLLASSSADSSVKVWDLSTQCVLLSLQHPDKVQSVEWHKTDISLLATGCSDGVVRLYNCEDGSLVTHWKLSGEIEKVLWNYHIPDHLLVSSDNCQVYCLNKSTGNLQYTIDAHSKSITDMNVNLMIPGLLVTCSDDGTVKFWNIKESTAEFLYSKTMHMGALLCCKFCTDNQYTLAIGGQKNGFQLMNILSLPALYDRCSKVDGDTCNVSNPTGGDVSSNDEEDLKDKTDRATGGVGYPVILKNKSTKPLKTKKRKFKK